MIKKLNVEYYENKDLRIGVYVIVTEDNKVWFNFNDLCDSLDVLTLAKRRRMFNSVSDFNKDKITFTRENNRESSERFVTATGALVAINKYGEDIRAVAKRKDDVENFITKIINKYEPKKDSMTYSSYTNNNIIDVLRRNINIENIVNIQPKFRSVVMQEEVKVNEEVDYLTAFCNEMDEANRFIEEFMHI